MGRGNLSEISTWGTMYITIYEGSAAYVISWHIQDKYSKLGKAREATGTVNDLNITNIPTKKQDELIISFNTIESIYEQWGQ